MAKLTYRNGLLAYNEVRVRKAFASKGDDATLTRFVKVKQDQPRTKPKNRQGMIVGFGHPTVEAARSIFFRKGVKNPAETPNVLVSGHNNVKIGRDVRKGEYRGYWIYTLSLEERATCPRSCAHWYDCYGNNMPFARRMDHRDYPALIHAIKRDVAKALAVRGRVGVLVRLHALGDFFSPEYVAFWLGLLKLNERLSIYGYTAHPKGSPIGDRVAAGRKRFGRRFAVRHSDGRGNEWNTISVASVDAGRTVGAIACPEQTGQSLACATCALCWSTPRTIAFVDH